MKMSLNGKKFENLSPLLLLMGSFAVLFTVIVRVAL
jgi:hypothetical protein